MTENWRCPNDTNTESASPEKHKFFNRTHRQVVIKTFLGNGRQWAFDTLHVLEDEPIGEMICVTCGAVARREEKE